MPLFSYKNGTPGSLPVELSGASNQQLVALGYSGPIEACSFNPRTQQALWTGSEWNVVDFSAQQIEENEYKRLLSRVDWQKFTEQLMASNVYSKARAAAAIDLQVNVDCTELIAFLSNARVGSPYIQGINNCFASIDASLDLPEEDKAQLYQIVQNCGLSTFLVVPDYTPLSSTMGGQE